MQNLDSKLKEKKHIYICRRLEPILKDLTAHL